jgi:hypothetical protein
LLYANATSPAAARVRAALQRSAYNDL